MKVINENTVVVSTSSELKSILEANNSYTYIYFDNDITLESGIKIPNSKINVTIDGTYNGIRHTFTDKKSLSSGDTISVSAGVISVTACNMDVIGYNYYGLIYVPDSSSYKNVVVEYNNIIYNGPQMAFNPTGLTRFIDCDVTISDGELVVGNEVAECNRIELGGISNIIHNSKSNSAFWFRNSNPSLTILSGAVIHFSSEYRELFYGVSNLSFTILSNGYFSVTSHNGMAFGNYGTRTTNIASNGEFILKQTALNGSYATWYSYGIITLNDSASLSIINNYSSIGTSNYNISFSNNGGLVLNNPKRFVLYNEKANVINTSSNISFDFEFSRVNLFDKVISIDSVISSSNMPLYSWYKEKGNSSIKGKFNSSTCTIESHNFTNDELSILPSLSNFVFSNKKIFSIGNFAFRVNALTDSDTMLSGISTPNSSILISYNDVNNVVIADNNGKFSYSYENTLDIGTIITFNAKLYDDVIYHTKNIQIVYSGEIVLESASSTVSFKLNPISQTPLICPRDTSLNIIVTDSRINSSDWKLYASIKGELISNLGEVFEGELIYKDSSGNIYTLSTTPTLVYTGSNNEGNEKTTTVSWNDDEGILLRIDGKIIYNKEYTSSIVWNIEE